MLAISRRLFAFWGTVLVVGALLAAAMFLQDAHAYLTGIGIQPPPASGTYGYNTFKPGTTGFPGIGQSYVDPVFNETVRRLTDETTPAQTAGSDIYSKNGFFNADNTLMYHRTADNIRTIIDPRNGAVVCSTVPVALPSDSSFDPVDPMVWYYFSGNELRRYIITAGSCQPDANPVKIFGAALGKLGGSVDWIDASGRYMVLNIGGMVHVWDKQDDVLYSNPFSFNDYADNGNGWVGISPDGKYLATAGASMTHYSFAIDHVNRRLESPVLFWTMCGGHADLVSASNGKTYYVSFDCHTTGDIYRVDVTIPQSASAPGKQLTDNMRIVDLDTSGGWHDVNGHFSGVSKGPLKDWVYVSIESTDDVFNAGVSPWRPYKQEILMVNVVTQEIRRLAHHRSRSTSAAYYRQPRVSASWDGGIVAWASNFNLNNGFDYADIYAITVSTSGGGGGGDTTAPTVSITAPPNGGTVSGTVAVTANAVDNIGVVGVQFKLNGANLGAEDTSQPYSVSWDTTQVANGTHTLTAVARDAAGNATTSSAVSVMASNNLTVENVVWTSAVNVTVTGNSLQKTSGCQGCADAGAVSQQQINSGDGYVEIAVAGGTTGMQRLFGLSNGNPGTTGDEIDFALDLYAGKATVRESGAYRAETPVVNGDVVRVSVEGGVVKYRKNGAAAFYESTVPPVYPLLVDTAFYNLSSTINNAVIGRASGGGGGSGLQAVVWTNKVNVTATGNSLQKTGGCNGCDDAGAVSQQQIASGDGYVEVTVSGTTLNRWIGLSNGNPGTSTGEIDFGLRLYVGAAAVMESGQYKAETPIATGDILRIAVEGGVVKYRKNGGTPFHTSVVTPAYPLLVDTSLLNSNSTLDNVMIFVP